MSAQIETTGAGQDCFWSSFTSYITAFLLTLSDALNFLDNHAAAFGVLLGFMTFAVNFYFQRRNSNALVNKQ